MESSNYVNLSSKVALLNQLNAANNNIANANTHGYNQDVSVSTQYQFRDLVFSNDVSTILDRSLGSLTHTGNMLDVAFSTPNHYFAVSTVNGVHYTRNGNFFLNKENKLVTQEGFPVLNQGGVDIDLEVDSSQNVIIDATGTILAGGKALEKIGVYSFANLYALRKEGGDLLSHPGEAVLVEDYKILQGVLESSNVSSIKSMTDLINLSRGFDQSTNLGNSLHKLSSDVINTLLKMD